MKVNGNHYRTIWIKGDDNHTIQIIDQRALPHEFVVEDLNTVDQVATAIKDMHVRGAGLIGATAGYGMYLAVLESLETDDFNSSLEGAANKLINTRPTAVNLKWAVDRMLRALEHSGQDNKKETALKTAIEIADEDANYCMRIGEYGVKLLENLSKEKKSDTLNILTHCNAGWLAFVDFGSATSPIYKAHKNGLKIHVWVNETRPRSQGAKLTAWELQHEGIPHTVITDSTSGHLMQQGLVDLVITGSDRTTYTGDVANKIGTYMIALAAKENNVPFYVALPSSTFDWNKSDGIKEIQIEERSSEEVQFVEGLDQDKIRKVLIMPAGSKAANFAFDVTPSHLVTGLITERGICEANRQGILNLFPEHTNQTQS